jgi:hypothetical protein
MVCVFRGQREWSWSSGIGGRDDGDVAAALGVAFAAGLEFQGVAQLHRAMGTAGQVRGFGRGQPGLHGKASTAWLATRWCTVATANLVAGDKTGQWKTWYGRMIPVADARYKEYIGAKENPS